MTPDEPDLPDIERLWLDSIRPDHQFDVERRALIQRDIIEAIRCARRGRTHVTAVDLAVLIPRCMGCACSGAKATDSSWPIPDVFGKDAWRGYEDLGFPRKQVQEVKRALKEGNLQPRCRQCGSSIDVVGEGFVVERTTVAEYFGVQSHDGRKPPAWMKDAVLKGFGGRCAGCRKTLTPDTATFDHVVARAKGGITDLTNLQPLCKQCNQTKADQDVEVVEAPLTFPLRPLPPVGYEGVIW
jgi:5-methylcytosine-specific restriction endonuclease McrA